MLLSSESHSSLLICIIHEDKGAVCPSFDNKYLQDKPACIKLHLFSVSRAGHGTCNALCSIYIVASSRVVRGSFAMHSYSCSAAWCLQWKVSSVASATAVWRARPGQPAARQARGLAPIAACSRRNISAAVSQPLCPWPPLCVLVELRADRPT